MVWGVAILHIDKQFKDSHIRPEFIVFLGCHENGISPGGKLGGIQKNRVFIITRFIIYKNAGIILVRLGINSHKRTNVVAISLAMSHF